MSIAANQQRTLLGLLAKLRPHWRTDRNLPARIQKLLTSNRAFGSRDRRLYRELLYTALRYLPWIEPTLAADETLAARTLAWLAADSPATQKFRESLLADAGWPPCPVTLPAKQRLLEALLARELPPPLPEWFRDHCAEAFSPEQSDALLRRAPLWLRLQTSDASPVTNEFLQLGWRFERSPVLPSALRLLDEVDVTQSLSFQSGLVEIQDLGSQLLLESVAIEPAGNWLDACAGAGGKTLQLARLIGPAGRIDAHDVRLTALNELAARAQRARIGNVRILPSAPPSDAVYDGVLVDAPCSGSGTWRRAPHLKWTTSPRDIADAATLQNELLNRYAHRVRPGGQLVYATCSLSEHENQAVAARFLSENPDFSPLPGKLPGGLPSGAGVTLLPATHDTDGFFVAAFRRR